MKTPYHWRDHTQMSLMPVMLCTYGGVHIFSQKEASRVQPQPGSIVLEDLCAELQQIQMYMYMFMYMYEAGVTHNSFR